MPRGQYQRRQAVDTAPEVETSTPIEQPVSPRAVEMRRERRRRDDGDLDGMAKVKLSIPREIEEQGKREGKVFRYFLEDNVPGAFENDWDKVEGVPQVLANPRLGEQTRLVLCSKYKDWHEADTAQAQDRLDERDKAMMRGHVSAPAGDAGSSGGLYVPQGQQNRTTRQRGL